MAETPPQTENQNKNKEKFLEKNQYALAVFLLGILISGLGVLGFKIFNFTSGPKVEILEEENPINNLNNPEKIIVEISGEVLKPGVYELPFGSRVNDLLTAAGGLTAEADKDWVAKNLNKAVKLKDSDKIYIPSKSETNTPQVNSILKDSPKINLNTATESELESLWGIGQATAQKIINGRPYQRPEELLERKIIKSNVWEKIKDQVTLW